MIFTRTRPLRMRVRLACRGQGAAPDAPRHLRPLRGADRWVAHGLHGERSRRHPVGHSVGEATVSVERGDCQLSGAIVS
jgi:hypothetical protein